MLGRLNTGGFSFRIWALLRPIELFHIDLTPTFYKNNNVTRLATTLISFDNAQMDLPPLRCLSKDQIQVTVDATLIYNISKPQVAVYETGKSACYFTKKKKHSTKQTMF